MTTASARPSLKEIFGGLLKLDGEELARLRQQGVI